MPSRKSIHVLTIYTSVMIIVLIVSFLGCSSKKDSMKDEVSQKPAQSEQKKLLEFNKHVEEECKGTIAYGEIQGSKMAFCYIKIPDSAREIVSILNKRPEQKWYILDIGEKPGEYLYKEGADRNVGTAIETPKTLFIPDAGTNGTSEGHDISFNTEKATLKNITMTVLIMNTELVSRNINIALRSDRDAYNMLVDLAGIFDSGNAKNAISSFVKGFDKSKKMKKELSGNKGVFILTKGDNPNNPHNGVGDWDNPNMIYVEMILK